MKMKEGEKLVISRAIRDLQKLEDVLDAEEVGKNDLTGKLWLFISTQDDNLGTSTSRASLQTYKPLNHEDWKNFLI